MNAVVGSLGAPDIVFVDPCGTIEVPAMRAEIEWMVRGERWSSARFASGVRQVQVGGAAVCETRLSVARGDVVQRVYGVGGARPVVVVEFENDSPGGVALALIVRGLPGSILRSIAAAGTVVSVDRGELLASARAPQQTATGPDDERVRAMIEADATTPALPFALRDRRRGVCAACVWPLPHRATLRVVIPSGHHPAPLANFDFETLPDSAGVARGWEAQLQRGLRFEIDDALLARAVDGARTALLLLAGADRPRPAGDVVAALEGWGFDGEAAAVWRRLPTRERRVATSLAVDGEAWVRVKSRLAASGERAVANPAKFLRALRAVLIAESNDALDLLPGFPPEWLGQNLAVHAAPTRRGVVSFAVRWHGDRPALLWDAPAGVTLRAPRLDAAWCADGGTGEALLAAPTTTLLALGTAAVESAPRVEPGSFS